MKRLQGSIVVALAATLFAGVAGAGETPPRTERPTLKQLDANGDGLLSRAEVASQARLAEGFDKLDANRDGQLSPDELKQGAHAQHGERKQAMREAWTKADANGDGSLSRAEAKALPKLAERFDRLDANGDGQISPEELRAGQHQRPRAQP